MSSIERQLRWLRAWALTSSVLFAVLLLGAFGQPRQRFTEIDVERINIVEPDGKYRMVISNRPRSIGPIYKGESFGYPGGTRPGIIFFNDEGTENGGLTFSGKVGADGKYQASHHLSFDQFNQDQVLYFNYTDNNGSRRMGFTIADRADVDIMQMVKQRDSIVAATAEGAARNAALQQWAQQRPGGRAMFAQRVYVGRDPARNAVVNLSDPEGRTRLRLVVDSLGNPAMEFLDAQGKVLSRLPQ
ncbi:MAG: hypothetical protein IPK85_06000 [Gemmatimonadetes bacterium]|nr:hypothetical protein [Gemmatimonadota bacterium]